MTKNEVFSPGQKLAAHCLYSFLAQINDEQRKGAVGALATVLNMIEDGFLSINDGEIRQDFYVQCFDILMGSALALKGLEDDGLCPQDYPHIDKFQTLKRLGESKQAVDRIEHMLLALVPPSPSVQ